MKVQAAARRMAEALGVPFAKAELALTQVLGELLCEATGAGADTTPLTIHVPAYADRRQAEDRPAGSYFRVPFLSKAADARPLQRVVARAADELGLSHYLAAAALTFAFEQIATEIGHGEVVRCPGFGVFGPWLWAGKDGGETVTPRFVAGRPLRLHVRLHCNPAHARNDDLRRYQRSHHPSSRPEKEASRTYRAMEAFRADINRQAGHTVTRRNQCGGDDNTPAAAAAADARP